MKSYLLFLVVLIIYTEPAVACSCNDLPPPLERRARSSAVFIGTLIASGEVGESRVLEFSVGEIFKGELKNKVRVTTPKEESRCGIRLSLGARYLVFAGGSIEHLITNLCSGNRGADSTVGRSEITILRSQSGTSQ